MHNNGMAASSRDHPSMLATGRYPQWRLQFLRYIDTRLNGEALRKCILSGPYKPTTVLVQAVAATDVCLAIPEHTTVETPMNMSPANKAHFEAEKEVIHLILIGIRDEIYSTVDACQTAQEIWEAIKRLQQGESLNIQEPEWSRFVTIVKHQHKLDKVSYHKLFDILKQYQKEVNELRAERLARNANPLALVATAQANQDPYYQTSKSHKSYAPSPKPSILTRSHTTTRHKGKEIAKPITPPSEIDFEEDSDPKQTQRDKDMQNNLALIAKTMNVVGVMENGMKTPKSIMDSAYHKEKMLLCKQAKKCVPLQAEQYDWLADTYEEIDEQELEVHYSYMAKIQEVPTADSCIDSKPVEQVKHDTVWNEKASNVFRKKGEKYFEIQDLKAQLQDKNIDISELKKLIEKRKGKYVETKFDKLSVVQQPNAQRIPKPLVLGKLAPFSNSLERIYFSKTKSVSKANVLEGLSKPVTAQTLSQTARQAVSNTNVLKQECIESTTGVNHETNVSRPQHRSNLLKDKVVPNNSQVKLKKTQVKVHPRIPSVSNKMKSVTACNDSLYSRTLNANAVCATCNKCLVDSNHFAYVTKMLNDVNARTKKPNVVPISTRKPKSHANKSVATPYKKKVASKSINQKLQSYFKMLYEKPMITVRTERVTKFLNKTLNAFFKEEEIEHQTSTTRTPKQNGIIERQDYTLVVAAHTMLSASKLPLFFWAGAIAITCYTQNRSIIIPTHDKMVYHIINDRKPSIKHLHIFGCTCYITRDGKNLDKIKEKGDLYILVGYSTQSKGYRVYNNRTRILVESIHILFDEIKEVSETSIANITSCLVPQQQKASDYDNSDPVPQQQDASSLADVHVPSHQELDLLFIPLHDEFFNAGSNPQDKQPTTNIQPTSAPSTSTYVHAEENNDDQAEEDHLPDDEFTNLLCAPAQDVAKSSSNNIGNSNVSTFNQPQVSKYLWTKDHPLEQIHRNPSRLVQTRRQIATDPEMCMFTLTVSTSEPKNIKEAMADSAWIEAI
uniref:Retroviral polymerase SH3-like domain-containing protein n=1 Tax=Tanacetum cinerariifolium TaxID=118510 RepID=A0A6L2LYK3_TANCI|nr:hypothetical protein [Tanacetum cinerariifolium]